MFKYGRCFAWMFMAMTLAGCASDRFQEQSDSIKHHVERFYAHVASHQIPPAISDNEQIETIALRAEEHLLTRVGQMKHGEKMQLWQLIKTAKEAAAENWLALGRYLVESQQYDQARSIYKRLINTYELSPYQVYVERARRGLRRVEALEQSPTRPAAPAD